jgi:hypothetical protein
VIGLAIDELRVGSNKLTRSSRTSQLGDMMPVFEKNVKRLAKNFENGL